MGQEGEEENITEIWVLWWGEAVLRLGGSGFGGDGSLNGWGRGEEFLETMQCFFADETDLKGAGTPTPLVLLSVFGAEHVRLNVC